ncbi:MAG: spermidine/putrescine ABC transporter ATP-binding protein [Gammaproteobacteria bacterium]|nr:spermidine/putrescine ABC transporter ATP-binding protein [Gammaproteobacteria bacterium]|tara:strand:- start:1259 stop:2344 length:1086 start_codon:yes stop_codon:yes gene_type:complete
MEIALQAISKAYDGVDRPAVSKVSASIASGEFFFLLGPSGCGKTTLLRLVAGLIRPTSGGIAFDGEDVTELPVDQRGTALVFQGYALWPHMTVLENVEFGPRMSGASRDARRRVAMEQLERVQMAEFAQRKPNQLSGGQQQRVALARALAAGTRCLLFDEPLSNLDARLRLHMRDELKTLVKETGVTAIYVTHDQKEALSMADRVAVMNDGEIVQLGTPEEVYSQPATRFIADFLGEANFLGGAVAASGDAVRVTTTAGEIMVSSRTAPDVGSKVQCCVRPEHVRIRAADEGPDPSLENALEATIVSSVYLGDVRQYVCRLGDGADGEWRVAELSQNAHRFEPGQPVLATFAASSVAVLRT